MGEEMDMVIPGGSKTIRHPGKKLQCIMPADGEGNILWFSLNLKQLLFLPEQTIPRGSGTFEYWRNIFYQPLINSFDYTNTMDNNNKYVTI